MSEPVGSEREETAIAVMLAEKQRAMARLKIEIETLETALKRMRGDLPIPRKRHKGTKGTLLDFLIEKGADGLNARTAVAMAKQRGLQMRRATVSSLLSRLKRESVIEYDGLVYRVPGKAPTPPGAVGTS